MSSVDGLINFISVELKSNELSSENEEEAVDTRRLETVVNSFLTPVRNPARNAVLILANNPSSAFNLAISNSPGPPTGCDATNEC